MANRCRSQTNNSRVKVIPCRDHLRLTVKRMDTNPIDATTERYIMQLDHSTANSLFATSTAAAGGGVSWFLSQLYLRGPSWSVIPPLLFSLAAITSAVVSGLKARQEAKHKQEFHQERIRMLRARVAEEEAKRKRLHEHSED